MVPINHKLVYKPINSWIFTKCGYQWMVPYYGLYNSHYGLSTTVIDINPSTKVMWVKQCHLHHPPVITIFIGGIYKPFPVDMVTIPSHGW